MEHVGKKFCFDYGDFAVEVHYLSEARLVWEQLKGPQAGSKAEQSYASVMIRPHLYFISWQEADTSMVVQVVDFELKQVYTTWISPEKSLFHFQGTLSELTA
jgi:hypothetical protein